MGKINTQAFVGSQEDIASHRALDVDPARWLSTSVTERLQLLSALKDVTFEVAEDWVRLSAEHKGVAHDSPHIGEEWLAGPYALIAMCNAYARTLAHLHDHTWLDHLVKRETATGNMALTVNPSNFWDKILFAGIRAELWMQDGVKSDDLPANSAQSYRNIPSAKTALVLGAGNVSSIAPLDCLYKLFVDSEAVVLKLNPVNTYLAPIFERALAPLINMRALQILTGDGEFGAQLVRHPQIDTIHITGAAATHDAIVWGRGDNARRNKQMGTPINSRPITSELGAASPTIVVPGDWSAADIRFQAAQIATQKLNNAGFNCVACQVMIMPSNWAHRDALLDEVTAIISASKRKAYYPGSEERIASLLNGEGTRPVNRDQASDFAIRELGEQACEFTEQEVFGHALGIYEIDENDPEAFLVKAIDYANSQLIGTLGANIVIHPKTRRALGNDKFDRMLAQLHYGIIGVNIWSGAGFAMPEVPWGAYPGHELADIQSGMGTVHNGFMLSNTQKTVLYAPWAPFPRNLALGSRSLLRKPAWFVTHRRGHILGRLITQFAYRPRWYKLPRLFWHSWIG